MTAFLGLCLRLSAVLALAAAMVSCADRPGPNLLHPVAVAPGIGTPVQILVATTRKRSETNPSDFTDERNFGLSYERYTISIPPTHVAGTIEWPSEPPGDPKRNFVVTSSNPVEPSDFSKVLLQGKKSGEVVVFIHGYNTNYQEAVYRVAQLSRDSGYLGSFAAFAWPSTGTLTGYVADREASTYSRDYLEDFLNELAATPGITRINIIAHSMGNWLTVETLRQAKLRAHSAFLPKLGEVFLMSPDIDIAVFRTQLDAIGKLNEPITVGISRDDKALSVSQRIAGDVPRVGNVIIDNPRYQAAIERYGLRVIDMSNNTGPDSLNHSKFVSILPALDQVARRDQMTDHGNAVSRTGTFVVNTAGGILLAPLRLGEAIVGQ